MRAHNRGSVAPAGGTAHVRPHGGVSGLSAGVPVKELGLHSLEGHRRVWAGVCMPVCMCDAIRAMCPESIPLAAVVWRSGKPSEGLPSSLWVWMAWGLWKGPGGLEQVGATWQDGLDQG